jgi:ABC-type Fe3+-hydroxamate transport system substrate-binding protein
MTPAGETRIASLVPSLTELVCALGLGAQLVGRTGFCLHPADELREVPKLGGTKDVLVDRLRALRPSHVLLNIDENRLDTAQAIRHWPEAERPQLLVTHPGGPEEVGSLVQQFVDAFGNEPGVPAAVRAALRHRAAALQTELEAALALTRPQGRPPCKVLYLIWRGPWMTVARDTYLSRMLARVNWQSLPDTSGGPHGAARYPVLRGDEPWLAGVERVLLSSEPYAFGPAHVAEAQALCPRARVELVDGEALSWYGPRTLAGLVLLRRLAAELPAEAARAG